MKTYDDKIMAAINYITTLFMNKVSKCDLTPYFNISISTNIAKDCIKYDKTLKPNPNTEYAGLTLLPCNSNNKIHILISEKSCTSDTLLHELTHMYDLILFSNRFCNGRLSKIRQHEYYQTLVYWSEFHAKLIDIPYTHFISDMHNGIPENERLFIFASEIKTFYYPEYTEKFINKQNIGIKDILWYLGELAVCNLYDKNNTYNISENIIHDYGLWILQLYNLLFQCQSFDGFADNVEAFRTLLQ